MPWMLRNNWGERKNGLYSPVFPMEELSVSAEETLVGSGTVEGKDAQELLNKIENNPEQFWIDMAHAYAQQGNYEQAIAILQQLK